VQAEKPPVSSSHENVLFGLLDVKTKPTLAWLVSFGGLLAGSIVTTGFVRSIVHVKAETLLSLPAASDALAWNVCEPSPSESWETVAGHGANGSLSSLHRIATAASLSLREKLALVDAVTFGRLVEIAGGGGGLVSTVQEYEVAGLWFPAGSTAVTENVCGPSWRLETPFGLVHAAAAPPSSLHRNVAVASASLNEKLALVLFDGFVRVVESAGAGGAVRSIVHVEDAASLVLPAVSRASTVNVCRPSLSGPNAAGLVQSAYASESRLHRNVAVGSASLNEKEALADALSLGGFEVIVGVAGCVVSIVQTADVAELWFPAVSTAVTANVCCPSERLEYVFGLVHGETAPPSSMHRKVAVVSSSVKEKLALEDVLRLGGPAVIAGAGGGVESIVHEYDVGALVLPAASTAATENPCAPSMRPEYAVGLVHAD